MRTPVVLLLVGITLACGGSSPSTPTAPTPPVPAPQPVPVPVVTNYAGQWAGTYTVTACDQAGAIAQAQWCEQLRALPSPALRLDVTQTDRAVSAVLTLGSESGSLTGQVGPENQLTLSGDYATTRDGAVILTTVGGWDTSLHDPTHMVGRFAINQRVASYSGNLYFEATLTTFTR